MLKNSRIDSSTDWVIKTYPADAGLEFQKAGHVWRIAIEHGFNAPRPVEHVKGSNIIRFEKLETQGSIRDSYVKYLQGSNAEQTLELIHKIGMALAILHRELFAEKYVAWKAPSCFKKSVEERNRTVLREHSGGEVFLHCDFGFSNIEIVTIGNVQSIAIFDSSPNYYSTFHPWTLGPREVDVGTFVACLYGQFPIRNYLMCRWNRIVPAIHAFVDGYTEVSGRQLAMESIREYAENISRCYFAKKYRNPTVRWLAHKALFSSLKPIVSGE